MNGRTLFAGVSSIAAIAFTLILTTQNLKADPAAPVDEVTQLRTRVAALEAEVKALRAELKEMKASGMPGFHSFKFDDKDFKLDGKDFKSEVKIKINGKEYVLPRDKDKLQKEQPNMKFGAGAFGFGKDGESFKFDLPELKFEGKDGQVFILPRDFEKLKSDPNFKMHNFDGRHFEMSKEIQEAMRKAMEELRKSMKELPKSNSDQKTEVAPTSI